ncbi:MAG: glycosyltransferase [Streptosporangiaceae bacterium]
MSARAPDSAASAWDCSVGVMAYNEEANIADALASILDQQFTGGRRLAELIVVASGCEDKTCAIVADIAARDSRVRLIEQEQRQGKASAINLFIDVARYPLLVLVSADLLVKEGALDGLLSHFDDPAVGMVGGHPTPVNGETTFLGYAVHLQWRLHDRISVKYPKLGEIVAFRSVVPNISLDTAVDELSLQAIVSQLGYRLVYEPRAVVYNRGPATVGDFLRQRRRIYAGHLRIRKQQGYSAPTMSPWVIGQALRGSGSFATPRAALWTTATVVLEAFARALGTFDVMRRREGHMWKIAASTKHNVFVDANTDHPHNVAVFHIVDFHRQRLEVGAHASRQLTRRVADHVRQDFGSAAIVSVIQQSGTVIATLPGNRADADLAACAVVRRFESTPVRLNDNQTDACPTLAYAIVAFPSAGPPLADVMPVPRHQSDPATTAAS